MVYVQLFGLVCCETSVFQLVLCVFVCVCVCLCVLTHCFVSSVLRGVVFSYLVLLCLCCGVLTRVVLCE